jgi:hypothetical protein
MALMHIQRHISWAGRIGVHKASYAYCMGLVSDRSTIAEHMGASGEVR